MAPALGVLIDLVQGEIFYSLYAPPSECFYPLCGSYTFWLQYVYYYGCDDEGNIDYSQLLMNVYGVCC